MRYVFGHYEIDLERYELCCNQRPVKIEPKAFDALVYLVQHRDRVVSKEELFEQLWADQYVSEGSITYCISEARKAIGDSGRAQRLIKTIHGRGYSFIAAVQEAGTLDDSPPLEASGASTLPDSHETAAQELAPAAPPSPPTASPPMAERRQLTVMWCQLAVASNRGVPVDPEDQHDLFLLAQSQFGELIRQFQGHVSPSVGHSLLASFGYPQASEDDARRAIGAGLALRQTLTAVEPLPEATLTIRVGLHTGLVVVSPDDGPGASAPVALGNLSHIAAQLVSFAEANTVVVSSTTLQLIDGYVVHQPLGTFWIDELSSN